LVIRDVVSAAASADRYAILRPDGRVYEILGNGSRRHITGIEGNPIRVFAGGAHFGCVTLEGECWMWGCGNRGQLGNGRFTVAFTPSKVILKDGFCVIDGVAGEEHTMLMTVKDDDFVPVLPDRMKSNEYLRMVRLANALPGAFVASELDAKF
jgi:alpha-tubulin suppressor-like RCC1 family protein